MAAAAQVFVADLASPEPHGDDAHHLAQVLRLRPGETVIASDGEGAWRVCRYRAGSDPSRSLEPDGPLRHEQRPAEPVCIGFVPTKGDRPEWVVQKLTEQGVDRVVMVRSARSVVRWEHERAARAVERLRRVARLAAAQSRRAWLPSVEGVLPLAELAAELGGVSAPGGSGPLALAQPGGAPPVSGTTALAVGPEGGWDESELGLADRLVGLGPRVLRAETAAVAAGYLLCALRDGVIAPARKGKACNHHAE